MRIACPDAPSFAAAGTAPVLWAVYDALLGKGNWLKRQEVGGTVPVRFSSFTDPGDAGWHIDGSYDVGGQYFVNVFSRTRALLALILFTDVTEKDAPTEIAVGSHQDIPALLAPHGERGIFFADLELPAAVFDRPRALATGQAGDVYICHPFLLHRATWPHQGTTARIIAPPEVRHELAFELQPGLLRSVVEEMIWNGLATD